MAEPKKEHGTEGHVTKKQKALSKQRKPQGPSGWQTECSQAKLAAAVLQSIAEKMKASQTIQQVMTLYFK